MKYIRISCIACVFMLILSISVFSQTPRIDSLLQVVITMKDDTSKANTLNELARAYLFELNDSKKVGEYAALQLALSLKLNFQKGIAYGYLNRAIFYRSVGDFTTALNYDQRALQLMKTIHNKRGESSACLNTGLDYSCVGNYKEALDYMFEGVRMKAELKDKKGTSTGYINIGNIYETQGNYTLALEYQLKALKLREELKDKVGMSMAYNNMGNIFRQMGKTKDAFAYYQKSLKINEELNDQNGIANAYNNVGLIYFKQGKLKEALENYTKALHARERIDDQLGIATVYNNFGSVYLNQNKIDKALFYQRKSLGIHRKIGNKQGQVQALQGLGELYDAIGKWKEALQTYDEMLSIAKELNYKEAFANAYQNMADLYTKQKDFKKALMYTRQFHAIKDSILNKDNFRQVSELNTRYETDKKEKEILLLTKDQEIKNKIIRQQQLVRWGLIIGLILLFISVYSIYRRYRFKQDANILLNKQKQEIQQKNQLITDSIDYARTIQDAAFPTISKIQRILPNAFLFYRPKAIVSGDFYWFGEKNGEVICIAADSTGHGVPGAFMSLLGYNMLENTIKRAGEVTPSEILNELNKVVLDSFSENKDNTNIHHGMDMSVISLNKTNNRLQFSGAHNPLYIVRQGHLIALKADRMGVGAVNKHPFTNHHFELSKGDMIYLFTDGFPDQIGGPNRKKFYYPPFKNLLTTIADLSLSEQYEKLERAHLQWLDGRWEQTDDILIIGIRYE